MHYFLLFLVLLLFSGCANLEPFNRVKYKVKEDIFYPIYYHKLTSIKGMGFDSSQVSNKYLDQEMVNALEKVQAMLDTPSKFSKGIADDVKLLGITTLQIASASRSPKHQFLLQSMYKASYLKSFHTLGLAVDLKMRGEPFDFRMKYEKGVRMERYQALERILFKAGLVFSEPIEKDPNHVELFRYCYKKNHEADLAALKKKETEFFHQFKIVVREKMNALAKKRNKNYRLMKRLYLDLVRYSYRDGG